MKLNILIGLMLVVSLQANAQELKKEVFPLVISFQSHCCGVPPDDKLRAFILSFKKKYRIKKIKAVRIGPLGREGEYDLAFRLRELSKTQSANFRRKIKLVKKSADDPGSWSFEEKKLVDPETLSSRTTSREIIF